MLLSVEICYEVWGVVSCLWGMSSHDHTRDGIYSERSETHVAMKDFDCDWSRLECQSAVERALSERLLLIFRLIAGHIAQSFDPVRESFSKTLLDKSVSASLCDRY